MSRTSERRARREARRRRQQPRRFIQDRRFWFAGAGILALIVIGLIVYSVSTASPPTALPNTAIPVEGIAVPSMGANHIRPGEPHAAYNSMPPTSGPHYDTPAPWGKSDVPLPEETWVHNLEHGGIVALYNCLQGCPDLVNKLEALLKTGPRSRFNTVKLLITPYGKIQNRLTLVAWSYYLPLDDYDDATVRGFITAHQDKGPELVP